MCHNLQSANCAAIWFIFTKQWLKKKKKSSMCEDFKGAMSYCKTL